MFLFQVRFFNLYTKKQSKKVRAHRIAFRANNAQLDQIFSDSERGHLQAVFDNAPKGSDGGGEIFCFWKICRDENVFHWKFKSKFQKLKFQKNKKSLTPISELSTETSGSISPPRRWSGCWGNAAVGAGEAPGCFLNFLVWEMEILKFKISKNRFSRTKRFLHIKKKRFTTFVRSVAIILDEEIAVERIIEADEA